MNGPFQAVKLTDRVYWVGAIDWELREFHGYQTPRGTTYNAFLILADKITLVDTVKKPFKDEMLSRIASVINPADVSYIISNHAEMDHSGCLPDMIGISKPEKVLASAMGVKALQEHFHMNGGIQAVKDGEAISLGGASLQFFETRMQHWPDSMVCYLADDRLLFSQDAFGMHLATSERFDDQVPDHVLEYEAGKYYANILMLFAGVIEKTLQKLRALEDRIDMIVPDHGPIWRKNPKRILELYGKWVRREVSKKVLITYDTMWHSTSLMASAIAEGVAAEGAQAKVMPLAGAHRSDVAAELLDAAALVVGSPTLNQTLLPTVADVLTYLKGLKPRNLVGASFGSYGWGRGAVHELDDALEAMNVELVREGLRIKYVPDAAALGKCVDLGRTVARRAIDLCNQQNQK